MTTKQSASLALRGEAKRSNPSMEPQAAGEALPLTGGAEAAAREPESLAVAPDAGAPLRLDDYVPYQFALLSSRLSKALVEGYKDRYPLSRTEWRTMVLVAEMPDCVSMSLVGRSGMDAVAVHRAVLKLETHGYLTRESVPDDRRLKRLKLTPAGWRVYADIVPMARLLERQLLDTLRPEEVECLKRALSLLMEATKDLSGDSLKA